MISILIAADISIASKRLRERVRVRGFRMARSKREEKQRLIALNQRAKIYIENIVIRMNLCRFKKMTV